MSAEKLKPPEIERIIITRLESGWPEKVLFLIKLSDERGSLVIPEGVLVRSAPSAKEMQEMEEMRKKGEFDEEAFWAQAETDRTLSIRKGKFLAKDDKTGRTVSFEFNPNSDHQKKAA